MRRKSFEGVPCPVARTMDVLGDWWVPLVLREALYGTTRFADFERMLGISKNILSERLTRMVAHGLLEQQSYGRGQRLAYVLTERGHAAIGILAAMMAWADHWIFDDQPPITLVDRETGAPIRPLVIDAVSGEPFDARRARVVPGPSFPAHPEALAFRFPELASSAP